jgi:hypothetical protein
MYYAEVIRGSLPGGSVALGPGESTKKRPERRMGAELDLKPFFRSSRARRDRFAFTNFKLFSEHPAHLENAGGPCNHS